MGFFTTKIKRRAECTQKGHNIMNKVILVGRLTRNPEVRYSNSGENSMAIARYSLAVDRPTRQPANSDQPTADFPNIVAFGKNGEFAEKYLRKGTKILVEGRIQTGSYTNKDGQKVYTTDVVVERHEFVESKSASQDGGQSSAPQQSQAQPQQQAQPQENPQDGFMNIPDGIEEELPFN